MNPARRKFLKNIAASTTGIALGSSFILNGCTGKSSNPNFPFYSYLKPYNFGDFIPKDQGGKFIQQQLINSEEDAVIVEAVRNGLLQKILGDPINWAKLETTELEKSVWLNRFYYLPPFARLYYLTKDKSYLEDMMKIVRLWINDNPRES